MQNQGGHAAHLNGVDKTAGWDAENTRITSQIFDFSNPGCYTFEHKSGDSVSNWEAIVKLARDCHTKQAWEALFESYGEAMATTSNAKPLSEIFKILKADPQSLQYEPRIWGRLMQGCLSSWNLELGCEIAEFAKKI